MLPGPLTTASVYHLPTTAGQKQPYPASPDTTVSGTFLPMDRRDHALEGGDFMDPHEFYVPPGSDVRVADKLVINSVDYFVRRIFVAQFGGLAHKRVALSRSTHA